MITKRQNKKLNQILFLTVFLVLGILSLSFLFRWQVIGYQKYKSIASNRTQSTNQESTRGEIQFRDGETVAYSQPLWKVFVYKPDLVNAEINNDIRSATQTRDEFLEKVSNRLNITKEELFELLDTESNWIQISSGVDWETKYALETIPTERFGDKRYLTGLNFEFTSKRIYPSETMGSHIIGFLGRDLNSNLIGRGGIEQMYDGILRPKEGFVIGERDKFGNIIATANSIDVDAVRGKDIRLTIDSTLQKILERKVCEGNERYDAKSTSGVILDPKTGEVLALANCPTFNPNNYFTEEDASVFTNSALTVPYEVGSVAKVITMAAAVEELGVEPNDKIIDGHEGCRWITASNFDEDDKRKICTYNKMPMGPQTATEALVNSDNLAFINLAEELGKEKMHKYLTGFGVNRTSGLDLIGESIGYFPELDNQYAWHPVDIAVFSYGHGYQMNLIQTTKAISVIANDGYLNRPYLLKEIRDGSIYDQSFDQIDGERIISRGATKKVTAMMNSVFAEHCKKDFPELCGYPIASKSGTALIPFRDRAGYSSEINATYIGFDSSENSSFILAIKLEEPKAVEKLSYFSARPLWMETFSELKQFVNISRD